MMSLKQAGHTERFTVVFDGDIRDFPGNPLKAVTDFGVPRAVEVGDALAVKDDLLEALKEGRRAIGEHNAPADCYATGPLTGDPHRDLVECPACSFISLYDAAIAKAEGRS